MISECTIILGKCSSAWLSVERGNESLIHWGYRNHRIWHFPRRWKVSYFSEFITGQNIYQCNKVITVMNSTYILIYPKRMDVASHWCEWKLCHLDRTWSRYDVRKWRHCTQIWVATVTSQWLVDRTICGNSWYLLVAGTVCGTLPI